MKICRYRKIKRDLPRKVLFPLTYILFFFCSSVLPADDPGAMEGMLKIPGPGRIITAEQIAESGETDLSGLLDNVAGIRVLSSSVPERVWIQMRGLGGDGFGRALVLLDGIRLNGMESRGYGWSMVPLQRIERIEIIRGAGSAEYGNGAVAGIINIVTRDAGEEAELSAGFLYGGQTSAVYGRSRLSRIQLHAGRGTENTSLDVGFQRQTNEGFRDRTYHESTGAVVAFETKPVELITSRIGISYNQSSFQLPGGLTLEEYETDPDMAADDEDKTNEYTLRAGGDLEWFPADGLSLLLQGAYEYLARNTDMPSSAVPSFSSSVYHSGHIRPRMVLEFLRTPVPLRLAAGADFFLASLDRADYGDTNQESLNNRYRSCLDTIGGYSVLSLALSEETNLSLGIRYDTAEIIGEYDESGIDECSRYHSMVYDGLLRWDPFDGGKVHIKGGTLFRFPRMDEQMDGTSGAFYPDLKPETGWNLELGGKYEVNETFSIESSGYILRLVDEIAYDTAASAMANLDETRRIGADLELRFEPVKTAGIDLNYSYIYAFSSRGEYKGKLIPLVPAHSVQGGLDLFLLEQLKLRPTIVYISDFYPGGDFDNRKGRIDACWLLDFMLQYRVPGAQGMRLVLKCENLLDQVYAPYTVWNESEAAYSFFPAPGRSISLSAAYSY